MPFTHDQITFPDDIPAITVEGQPIMEEDFPRRKLRRFAPEQDVGTAGEFSKQHEANLDYAVDMTKVLEADEFVICASGWSSGPTELAVTSVRYAQKGALVFVHGGEEGQCYLVTINVRTNYHRVFTYRLLFTIGCHAFDALPEYEPPALYEDTQSCGCACNFFTDLLGEYVGPFYWDADAQPLFACVPAEPDGGIQ